MVVDERVGDLLRRPDERGRTPAAAGERRHLGPQALVEPLALRGGGQQALAARVRRRRLRAGPARLVDGAGRLVDGLGPRPGRFLRVGEDRAQRHGEARRAAVFARRRPDRAGDLAHLRVGLAPQGVDVGVLAGDLERRRRRAAEIHRDVRRANAANGGMGALDLVEAPGVVERPLARPLRLHHVEVLVRAGVAVVLGEEVAVLALLGVVATGDDVHGDAAAAELVERRELPRGDGGRGEAGAMRDHQAEAARERGGVGGHQHAVGRRRVEGDERAVEAGLLVGAGDAPDVVDVDDRPLRRVDLGHGLGVQVTDEFDAVDVDAHGGPPSKVCTTHSAPMRDRGPFQRGRAIETVDLRERCWMDVFFPPPLPITACSSVA